MGSLPAPLLECEEFKLACKLVPLVALDLLVRDPAGRVLLGLRKNPPAAGTWFAPGGRIRKGETLSQAFERIASHELGLEGARLGAATLRGAYDHFYDTDFTGDAGASTHYVVLAYDLPADCAGQLNLPHDVQHQEWRWMDDEALSMDPRVHAWTKAYFASGS